MIKNRLIYWIIGTLLAFAGVYVVKTISMQIPAQYKVAAMLTGYTMSIFGLFTITLGTRRKNSE